MIEAAALYAMLMLTLFAWCGIMGLIYATVWVAKVIRWDGLLVVSAFIGYIIWRLN